MMICMNSNIEYLCENIEKIITTDITGRGIIKHLVDASIDKQGPLSILKAARSLHEIVDENSIVFIMTGFRVTPYNIQETDGPIGAASIARSLDISLGALPIIITENINQSIEIVRGAARGLGLNVIDADDLVKNKPRHSISILGFPIDKEKAEEYSRKVIDKYNPSAVISIEKVGANYKGVYHTMRGYDVTNLHSQMEHVIEKADEKGSLTIGIGDGGNEIGMGVIEDSVRKHIPYGDKCQCPCQGGIAAHSKVHYLIVSTVSNWGGYALAGILGKISGKENALHTADYEENALMYMNEAGALDGVTGIVEKSVDSSKIEVHQSILNLINEILKK